jgi:hypothetical protein
MTRQPDPDQSFLLYRRSRGMERAADIAARVVLDIKRRIEEQQIALEQSGQTNKTIEINADESQGTDPSTGAGDVDASSPDQRVPSRTRRP